MEAAIKRADQLSDSGHVIEALGTIIEFKNDPNPEIQWRLAREIFKEAEFKGTQPKHAAIEEGIKILDKNLKSHPNCWNSHVWYAVLLGSKEKHDSFKQQIEEAFVIKEHINECLRINPNSEFAYHVLGHWCYQVASVSWLQRKTAATLFTTPPESTLEEALAAFKKAEELSVKPIFNNNHLFTAKVLLDLGRKGEAEEYLKKCLVLTEEKKNDKESVDNVEEAKKLAKKHGFKI